MSSVADPGSESSAFFDPGIRIWDAEKSDPGSGINILDSRSIMKLEDRPFDNLGIKGTQGEHKKQLYPS
jgi:hypothetical protein